MVQPERPAEVTARDAIAHLQQSIHGLMDGDRVLPAEGACLLAALEQVLAGSNGESTAAARAGIEAFIGRVQALIEAGVLDAADGPVEAAAALGALLRSAEGTDLQIGRPQEDASQG